jgi:drug/metabolite transporter (DMT)-like permease
MFWLMVSRYLLSLISFTTFFYIQLTSLKAGVNSSVIVSILGATSLFAAIAFYLIHKEHLKRKHLIGMILMISAVSMIASAS